VAALVERGAARDLDVKKGETPRARAERALRWVAGQPLGLPSACEVERTADGALV
jgi:aminoglycoside phosphotransferase